MNPKKPQPPAPPDLHITVSWSGILLAAFLWLVDSLFDYLWFHDARGSFLPLLLPLDDPRELLMRLMFSSVLILAGIVVGYALQQRLRQQRASAEIAEDLRITLDSIGDAVIATDVGGRVIRMNPVAERLTGWRTEEGRHQPLTEVFTIINAKTRQPACNPVEQVLVSGRIVGLANDTLLIARDGREYQIADSAAPIRDGEGRTTGVVLVFRDVTREYQMRREMEHASVLLQAVVAQAHVPMAVVTAEDNCFRMVNQACLDFLGVPEGEFLGKSLSAIDWSWKTYGPDGTLIPPPEVPIARALRGEATHGLELKIVARDGNIRFAMAEGVPIRDGGGKVIAGLIVLVDITDRKSSEEERTRLQKLESIGTLAGGIAHDFNNILTGIFGGIELAMIRLSKDHDAYKYIETAHQALERATHLSTQLLTFAKGGAPLLEMVNIRQAIEDAIRFNLSGSNLKAELQLPPDLWMIKADKGQISHVLANLIINAKQAMPAGGTLFIEAENSADRQSDAPPPLSGNYVRITIRDEGVGIPEKITERIFDPYFSTKQDGSGLGLAIVHSIVSKHNGSIRVDSTPGSGSTFTLSLPAERSVPCQTPSDPAEVAQPAKHGRILVMDDEELIRTLAAEMLGMAGYTVDCVVDGEEALDRYQAARESGLPFDLVIMDLTIPGGMGGKETVARLLGLDPLAKVIVTSGYSTGAIMADYSGYGFKGRLVKPFQLRELTQEIDRVLEEG